MSVGCAIQHTAWQLNSSVQSSSRKVSPSVDLGYYSYYNCVQLPQQPSAILVTVGSYHLMFMCQRGSQVKHWSVQQPAVLSNSHHHIDSLSHHTYLTQTAVEAWPCTTTLSGMTGCQCLSTVLPQDTPMLLEPAPPPILLTMYVRVWEQKHCMGLVVIGRINGSTVYVN